MIVRLILFWFALLGLFLAWCGLVWWWLRVTGRET